MNEDYFSTVREALLKLSTRQTRNHKSFCPSLFSLKESSREEGEADEIAESPAAILENIKQELIACVNEIVGELKEEAKSYIREDAQAEIQQKMIDIKEEFLQQKGIRVVGELAKMVQWQVLGGEVYEGMLEATVDEVAQKLYDWTANGDDINSFIAVELRVDQDEVEKIPNYQGLYNALSLAASQGR